ncbi:putative oxalocrotonate tautomerase [Podospora fimiseda]|uniref:Oxalocrotonate tautomerase n=1 Tax=Podospora fimiseda TaxID=252190 RepID=A0AAN7GUB9_9PEZI|nr:putative oxalocrotonate tautomerase [Podospora fimiseda]
MPLWLIYHPQDTTFTAPSSKQSLASEITTIYTSAGLPPFYVNVNFIPLSNQNMFVGGKNPETPFVRVAVDHIAVHFRDNEARTKRTMASVKRILKKHIGDNGWDWEVHIDETPTNMWLIAGIEPPPFQSEAEKRWVELGKPVEWRTEEGA